MAELEKHTSTASGDSVPTPPNPTPKTDALSEVGSPPRLDMQKVSTSVETIAEEVNESALPSPPVNTPEAPVSPAPSVYNAARGRGLSAVGDRLLQNIAHRRFGIADTMSIASTSAQEDEHDDREDVSRPRVSPTPADIPVALGAPGSNPLLKEYLAHHACALTSQDLVSNAHDDKRVTLKAKQSVGGVTERSNWGQELEEDFENILKRLEQLAMDEADVGASLTAEQYYVRRLKEFLESKERMMPVRLEVIKEEQ